MLVRAGWLADGAGRFAAPAALLIEDGRVVAAGTPQEVGAPGDAALHEMPEAALLPSFVNAHAHLDLTAVGPVPYGGDFDGWLRGIRQARGGLQGAALQGSVAAGVRALRAGGVAAVGDIASADAVEAVLAACAQAGVGGIVFQEVFGMGPRRAAALELVRAVAQVRVPRRGIEPHAPYSSDAQVFEAALACGLPVTTHLAESTAEREFLATGTGRFRTLLEELGLWDGSVALGARHPVEWIARRLEAAARMRAAAGIAGPPRLLAVHLNDLDDAALALLATLPVDVAYCPRASAYFGHAGHRYRELRAAGVRVCLGTDSIVCLDTPDRLSTLDEARLLLRRDGIALADALAMATVEGARALGLDPADFHFAGGARAGVLAVAAGRGPVAHPAAAARALAESNDAPSWISMV